MQNYYIISLNLDIILSKIHLIKVNCKLNYIIKFNFYGNDYATPVKAKLIQQISKFLSIPVNAGSGP